METQKIYRVTTEGDCEGRSIKTLGYATGTVQDIITFFDDKREYSINCDEIVVVHITNESLQKKKALMREKKDIEERLKYINSII